MFKFTVSESSVLIKVKLLVFAEPKLQLKMTLANLNFHVVRKQLNVLSVARSRQTSSSVSMFAQQSVDNTFSGSPV